MQKSLILTAGVPVPVPLTITPLGSSALGINSPSLHITDRSMRGASLRLKRRQFKGTNKNREDLSMPNYCPYKMYEN